MVNEFLYKKIVIPPEPKKRKEKDKGKPEGLSKKERARNKVLKKKERKKFEDMKVSHILHAPPHFNEFRKYKKF